MPSEVLAYVELVNGVGLARETQAPPGKPVSTLPFQGRGFERLGTQHMCFGNCAELSLNVIKGTWISAVLVCRPKDPFAVMEDPIAYLFCHDASTC